MHLFRKQDMVGAHPTRGSILFDVLPPLPTLDHHRRIKNPNEIVQADWGYDYDIAFFSGVPDPMDWRVRVEWVGMRATDCSPAWECFMKPKIKRQRKPPAEVQRRFNFAPVVQ